MILNYFQSVLPHMLQPPTKSQHVNLTVLTSWTLHCLQFPLEISGFIFSFFSTKLASDSFWVYVNLSHHITSHRIRISQSLRHYNYQLVTSIEQAVDGLCSPISHALVQLWKQEIVVELIDALDARKHLWNYAFWKKTLLVISMQQLVVKHLQLHHQSVLRGTDFVIYSSF